MRTARDEARAAFDAAVRQSAYALGLPGVDTERAYRLLGLIAGRAPVHYERLVTLGRALASWCVMTEGLTGGDARSMDQWMLATLESRLDAKAVHHDEVLRD